MLLVLVSPLPRALGKQLLVWRPELSGLRRGGMYLRLLLSVSPVLTTICALIEVVKAVATAVLLIASGLLVGSIVDFAVDNGETGRIWLLVVIAGVALVVDSVVSACGSAAASALQVRYTTRFVELVGDAALAPKGVYHLVQDEQISQLKGLVATVQDWRFHSAILSTWRLVGMRLAGCVALVVVLAWRAWVGLLLVVGWQMMSRAFAGWVATMSDDVMQASGAGRRRADYYRGLMLAPTAANEVRLFGMGPWLLGRYRDKWTEVMTEVWHHRGRSVGRVFAIGAGVFVLNVGAFGLLARDAWTGSITVAFVVTVAQALPQLVMLGMLGDVQSSTGFATAAVSRLAELRVSLGLSPLAIDRSTDDEDASRVGSVSSSVGTLNINNVTFTYPGGSAPALDGLDISIDRGEVVALVGDNGAGKSTLVRLAIGLYQPASGSIRVGGVDPWDSGAAKGPLSVVLQDFPRYELSLSDNIGIGVMGEPEDRWPEAERALRSVFGDDLLAALPHGEDTILAVDHERGVGLSGGEWQRVALARALAAAGPDDVLILDEPAAQLDVETEHRLYERLVDLRAGRTVVLVTHRLVGARLADRILVMDRGRVVESGHHDELIAADGHYATMFRLQAERFQTPGSVEGEVTA